MASNKGSLEGRGIEELRLLAAQGADGTRVLEQAFRLVFGISPRFSHSKSGMKLRSGLHKADRYHPDRRFVGAGVSWVIDQMLADREHGFTPDSLGYYARRLAFEAAHWRRVDEVAPVAA